MIAAFALAAAFVTERAVAATTFLDSIGVDTHFAYWDTPYGARFDTVAKLLYDLGVKHVRDGVAPGQPLACAHERALALHGIRFDYVTERKLQQRDLVAWAACTAPATESFEGPNEYDISHPPTDFGWVQTVQAYQKTLYAAVKRSPALHAIPVIGPSLTSVEAFRAVGDLSPYLDYGNMHDYFGGHEPGTRGSRPGGFGSIAYNVDAARLTSGTKPIVATENGYETGAGGHYVSEEIAAAYVPRMFLDQFAAGVVRTDEYELVDEGPESDAHFGLLRGDLSPKPSYLALKSFIAVLCDAGPARNDSLAFALEGWTWGADLRHALFEKHDGTFYLALWIERPSVEPHTHIPYWVAQVSVRVRTPAGARMRVFAYGDDDALHAGADSHGSATVSLTARVALVEIVP